MSDQFAALSEMLKGFKSNLESQTEILIKPTTKRNIPPVPPIRLHALDLLMPPINVSLPILFKITPALAADGTSNPKRGIHDEFESIVERLKLALAETLEMYPPIAGTIHASPDDASALTLVCDGPGAAFITKLEDRVYVENENTLPQLAGADIFAMDLKLPIFTVKLSLFSCGTMVMVTSMHHHAADLTSYMDFIGAWARLSRGEGLDMEAIPHSWSRDINLSLSVTMPSSMPGIMILPPPSATATPIPPPLYEYATG
ncbi:transferase family-domain-containing protein [Rhodocollybia butyracea]|uniref:Transferase family-domain-containing protein n=1 Tax=Rhodocollybia butyracea TaxID=206335 RepID=A0A9P5Q717_9AGAR|nr:transferase family-domain-containing protein [Rhodocollybia butyracea]